MGEGRNGADTPPLIREPPPCRSVPQVPFVGFQHGPGLVIKDRAVTGCMPMVVFFIFILGLHLSRQLGPAAVSCSPGAKKVSNVAITKARREAGRRPDGGGGGGGPQPKTVDMSPYNGLWTAGGLQTAAAAAPRTPNRNRNRLMCHGPNRTRNKQSGSTRYRTRNLATSQQRPTNQPNNPERSGSRFRWLAGAPPLKNSRCHTHTPWHGESQGLGGGLGGRAGEDCQCALRGPDTGRREISLKSYSIPMTIPPGHMQGSWDCRPPGTVPFFFVTLFLVVVASRIVFGPRLPLFARGGREGGGLILLVCRDNVR